MAISSLHRKFGTVYRQWNRAEQGFRRDVKRGLLQKEKESNKRGNGTTNPLIDKTRIYSIET